MIRKIIYACILGLVLAPVASYAAFGDVTLSTSTVITVGGINLDIYGDTAAVQSITVGDESFSFVLQSGSHLEVTSVDRRILTANEDRYTAVKECTSELSRYKYESNNSSAVTISLTPTSYPCASGASSGGGGPARVAATTVAAAAPADPAISSLLAKIAELKALIQSLQAGKTTATAPIGTGVSDFARTLQSGLRGDDVKNLQVFLNTHGFKIADSGPGSLGNETTYFGAQTKKALVEFQKANGISPIGVAGPATRSKIQSIQAQ